MSEKLYARKLGIIEGCVEGQGLGLRCVGHIGRSIVIVHQVDAFNEIISLKIDCLLEKRWKNITILNITASNAVFI